MYLITCVNFYNLRFFEKMTLFFYGIAFQLIWLLSLKIVDFNNTKALVPGSCKKAHSAHTWSSHLGHSFTQTT